MRRGSTAAMIAAEPRCGRMAACYNKAAEVCGGKYAVIDQRGQTQGSVVPMATGGVVGSFGTQYTLTVKCGAN